MGRMLFDHLVGALQDRLRNSETERLGGLQDNSKLEYRWLLDRRDKFRRSSDQACVVCAVGRPSDGFAEGQPEGL
jgi:hypothetical protein